jgi:hypothetical protein
MKHILKTAVERLLPHAEEEQESLFQMQKRNPVEYEGGYQDCRHAISYAYEALRESEIFEDTLVKAAKDMCFALLQAGLEDKISSRVWDNMQDAIADSEHQRNAKTKPLKRGKTS